MRFEFLLFQESHWKYINLSNVHECLGVNERSFFLKKRGENEAGESIRWVKAIADQSHLRININKFAFEIRLHKYR